MPSWSTPPTFAAGNTLTAAQLNTYVSDNTTHLYDLFYNAWATWTPTVTQSGTVSKTVNYGKYLQAGKLVVAIGNFQMTGSGTGNNDIVVTLPVTASTSTEIVIGSGEMLDSGTFRHGVRPVIVSTTTIKFWDETVAVPGNYVGRDPNFALASGDILKVFLVYEAA